MEGNRYRFRSTTVTAVRVGDVVAMAADGQVSLGDMIVKAGARKLRTMAEGKILAGFAGSSSDALTLFDKFEKHLEKTRGDITRAAVELVKEWRTDRVLRRLEALLLVADKDHLLMLSGAGDVIEPDEGIAAIGSGAAAALAAARALVDHTELAAETIARESVRIAAGICVHTNENIMVLTVNQNNS